MENNEVTKRLIFVHHFHKLFWNDYENKL
jgi:hypothetical protein